MTDEEKGRLLYLGVAPKLIMSSTPWSDIPDHRKVAWTEIAEQFLLDIDTLKKMRGTRPFTRKFGLKNRDSGEWLLVTQRWSKEGKRMLFDTAFSADEVAKHQGCGRHVVTVPVRIYANKYKEALIEISKLAGQNAAVDMARKALSK